MTLRGATPGAAARVLQDALQRLLSCVTAGVLTSRTDGLLTRTQATARLSRAAGGSITLDLRHFCALVSDASRPARERWTARTAGYFYALDDANGREIVGYHWHPTGHSHVTVPHVHLGAGAGALIPELTTAHLLTGRVAPTAVLLLAIERFGVAPRRSDWAEVFARVETDLAGA